MMPEPHDYITLHPSHPYLSAMDLDTYQVITGLWRVKWRDFLSIKQDAEFDNEDDARAFAERNRLTAHRVPRELLDDACTSYEEASSFWERIA